MASFDSSRTRKVSRLQRERRGIVILIVISLLAIFVLIGVAFVVVSSSYARVTRSMRHREETVSDHGSRYADEALMQIIRDTMLPSSLAGHSLLRDLYGTGAIRGVVVAAPIIQGGGELLEIAFMPDPKQPSPSGDPTVVPPGPLFGAPFYGARISQSPHFYAGSIATIEQSMWHPGVDGKWGTANFDDNQNGSQDDPSEAGFPNSDDRMVPAWQVGPDGQWGRAGVDDDGNGTVDDPMEAGWPGSDDRRPPTDSVRIIDSGFGAAGFWVRAEMFRPTGNVHGDRPSIGNRIVINGLPFSGTGVGFSAHTPEMGMNAILNGMDGVPGGPDDVHLALFPNFRANYFAPAATLPSPYPAIYVVPGQQFRSDAGGENEDYDAVDHQNMFIASVPPAPGSSSQITPSFHRKELLNHLRYVVANDMFVNRGVTPAQMDPLFERPFGLDPLNPADDPPPAAFTNSDRNLLLGLKRMCLLRPLPDDHPNFTGSNPNAATLASLGIVQGFVNNGLWDVDNNNDGIVDSIWVDIGLPVVTRADGKQYRPLVAILCHDLDGRLNLNAHSMLNHMAQEFDGNLLNNTRYATATLAVGADGQPGKAGVDDDNLNGTDDLGELGWPGSDDTYPGLIAQTLNNVFDPLNMGTNTFTDNSLPRGLGFGPAEVDFSPLFTPHREFRNIILGRYKATPVLSTAFSSGAWQYSGITVPRIGTNSGFNTTTNALNQFALNDYAGTLRWSNLPFRYPYSLGDNGVDESGGGDDRRIDQRIPLDFAGIGSSWVDRIGQPQFMNAGRPIDALDRPYEADLTRPTNGLGNVSPGRDGAWGVLGVDDNGDGFTDNIAEAGYPGSDDIDGDSPYSLADLEKLLRWNDGDAGRLQSRLVDEAPVSFGLIPGSSNASAMRSLFTTHSSHIPYPAFIPPGKFRNSTNPIRKWFVNIGNDGRPGKANVDDDGNSVVDDDSERGWPGSDDFPEFNILQLYRARLLNSNPAAAANWVNLQLEIMGATEFKHGRLFNVNRPFGNGRDDNGNGIVDEPGEVDGTGIERAWTEPQLANTNIPALAEFQSKIFGHGNDSISIVSSDDRQTYARHLFCLMMAISENGTNQLAFPFTQDIAGTPLTNPQKRELTAMRIAQWCINVVDYRDADAICTPFEFDIDPFNNDGWGVNGIVGFDWNPGPDGAWGVAGVDDNMNGTTDDISEAGNGDDVMDSSDVRVVWGTESPELQITESLAFHDVRLKKDMATNMVYQYRIPEGSLFFELYCTGPRQNSGIVPAAEFYQTVAGVNYLNLAAVTPVVAGSPQFPVWRVALSEYKPTMTAETLRSEKWSSASYEPQKMNLLANSPLNIERIVWFTGNGPTGMNALGQDASGAQIYYNRTNTGALIEAGGYAAIGPRKETFIGSQNVPAGTYGPSSQKIVVDPTKAYRSGYWDQTNTTTAPTKPAVDPMTLVPTNTKQALAMVIAADPPAAWANTGQTAPEGIGLSISEPLPTQYYVEPDDQPTGFPKMDVYLSKSAAFDPAVVNPIGKDSLNSDETKPNYKTAYLQRLANPLLPWNALTNPYLTTDWISIDLSVFNGEENIKPDGSGQTLTNVRLGARQRDGESKYNLWSPSSRLNATSGAGQNGSDWVNIGLVDFSFGYLNTRISATTLTAAPYLGDPPQPFPWMTWLNRPFVNQSELLVVPASSSSRLGLEFTPYSVPANGLYKPQSDYELAFAPFGHLLNFFEATNVGPSGIATRGGDLAAAFDLMEVPSPFVNTEKWLNPKVFGDANVGGYLNNGPEYNHFRPPFNKISRYRDPGRININTITDQRVWDSVRRSHPNMPAWGTVRGNMTGSSASTAIARPFRGAGSADLAVFGDRALGYETSLLRAQGNEPMLGFDSTSKNEPWLDSKNTPYFRYQDIRQVSNILTNRSNVFAVWITVGYFEVEPNPNGIDLGHPDGFRLGRELGFDTGNTRRHRAFYIIDRSVPVGFSPGEDMNTDKTILLRRYIE